ncbi:MAG: substrate-binding domain-containing protein [Prevotellaceae bacterium]|nr:substrate-binding domain-containing protein [Prevotellaceae bacterium]
MKKERFIFNSLSTLCFAVVLLLTSCGQKKPVEAGSDGLTGTISLSGAFALYPLAVAWADEFQQLHPGVQIDISAGGAGKGITDVIAGVVDLGMVSRELEPAEQQRGAYAIAVARDAVIPTINDRNPNLKAVLRRGLSRRAALALWATGTLKTWGQLAGNNDNTPINVYTRSDACGAAGTWAQWLGMKQEDLLGIAAYGDPGVATAIQRDVRAIGMNNIGYVYDSKTHRPNPHLVVIPIDFNNNGRVDANERFYDTQGDLAKAIADGRYPLPPARNLYLVTRGKPTNPVVVAFLRYILSKGQKLVLPQGFIPQPKAVIQKELAHVGT